MKKKNVKILDYHIKPQCAIFGDRFTIAGSDKIQVFENDKILFEFNQPVNTLFESNKELIGGTDGGNIFMWDLETQKQILSLKGHNAPITCFCIQNSVLISGSKNSIIKIWDLKSKQPIGQLKGHHLQINCLAQLNDIIASGAKDGFLRVWDLKQQKILQSFNNHDAPITCLRFDQKNLASGGDDRTIKYWDIEKLQLIHSTRPDIGSLQQLCFYQELLYSAASDSLKVWNIKKDKEVREVIESNWRNVQDIKAFDHKIQGLAICPTLQLFEVDVSYQNLYQRQQTTGGSLQKQRTQSRQRVTSDHVQQNASNLQQPQSKRAQQLSDQKGVVISRTSSTSSINSETHQSSRRNDSQKDLKSGMKQSIMVPVFQTKKTREIGNAENIKFNDAKDDLFTSTNVFQISQFIVDNECKENFKQIDIINEICKDHFKFMDIMKQRMNKLLPIFQLWQNKKYSTAIQQIDKLDQSSLINDCLLMIMNQIQNIPQESLLLIFEKSFEMIFDKHTYIQLNSLKFIQSLLINHKDIKTIEEIKQILKSKKEVFENLSSKNQLKEQIQQLKTLI